METQTHGVLRSLTRIRIALWMHWSRTQYYYFCTNNLDIDNAVQSALYPTVTNFSLKGEWGRNWKVTNDSQLQLRLRMGSPLPLLRQTSTMRSLRKDNIIQYTHTHTHKYKPLLDNLHWWRKSNGGNSERDQWKRTGHIPDKRRVSCQIFALS